MVNNNQQGGDKKPLTEIITIVQTKVEEITIKAVRTETDLIALIIKAAVIKAEKVMPVELSDEQIKNQIKETLEKLQPIKEVNLKVLNIEKKKRTYRREQDELQQELEAEADRTLRVTEFITVSELASLMDVSTQK